MTSSTWPSLYYSTVDSLIELNRAKHFLEIGVAFGWHAQHLKRKFPLLSYLGVDPYSSGYDHNDDFVKFVQENLGGYPQESLELLFKVVSNNLMKNKDCRLVRSTSSEFFSECQEKFDFIFIDGNHKFEFVIKDLEGAWGQLSKTGILAGDDYLWPEVAQAVMTFSKSINRKPHFASNSSRGYPIFYFVK